MIPLFRPEMGEAELANIREVFESGFVTLGPRTKEFEDAFSEYIGVAASVGLNCCTMGLHLSLTILGAEGGEVIVPAMTFVATANAAVYCGAKPVFADVEPDTLCLDPVDLERKITAKTKAVIPMHYGGHACDMDRINKIAKEKGIGIVEDCAHTVGGKYKDKMLGSLGDMAAFSFHAVKPLACGDGSMVTTNNQEYARQLIKLRWFGATKDTYQRDKKGYSWYYEIDTLGYKGYMNDITAAIGLAQLQKIDKMNARRRQITQVYNEAFKDIEWLMTPIVKPYAHSCNHNYMIRVDLKPGGREDLIEYMSAKGISTGVHYLPIYMHPYYKDANANTPVSDKMWKEILLLPIFSSMSDEQVDQVIDAVRDYPSA